jgi:hypothetical protein
MRGLINGGKFKKEGAGVVMLRILSNVGLHDVTVAEQELLRNAVLVWSASSGREREDDWLKSETIK